MAKSIRRAPAKPPNRIRSNGKEEYPFKLKKDKSGWIWKVKKTQAKKRSHGTKKKYSYYRGKGRGSKGCGSGGFMGSLGWCKARYRKSGKYAIRRPQWYAKGNKSQQARPPRGQFIGSEPYDIRRRSQR